MKYIQKQLNKIKRFITQNIVEILMFVGLFFILYASFLITKVLGLYVLGIIFIIFSIFLLKFPERR